MPNLPPRRRALAAASAFAFTYALAFGCALGCAAALLSGCAREAPDPKEPAPGEVALRFYDALLRLQPRGLPSDSAMRFLRPLLSPELDTLIENARHAQAHFIEARPGEKPPWIEGNLFASLYEGQHAAEVIEGVGAGAAGDAARANAGAGPSDSARASARLEYHADGDTVRWVDTLILARIDGAWRVADIRYGGDWAFRPGTSLRAALMP